MFMLIKKIQGIAILSDTSMQTFLCSTTKPFILDFQCSDPFGFISSATPLQGIPSTSHSFEQREKCSSFCLCLKLKSINRIGTGPENACNQTIVSGCYVQVDRCVITSVCLVTNLIFCVEYTFK